MERGEFGKVGSHGRLKRVIQPRAYELQKLSCFANQGDRRGKNPKEAHFSSMGERVRRHESAGAQVCNADLAKKATRRELCPRSGPGAPWFKAPVCQWMKNGGRREGRGLAKAAQHAGRR